MNPGDMESAAARAGAAIILTIRIRGDHLDFFRIPCYSIFTTQSDDSSVSQGSWAAGNGSEVAGNTECGTRAALDRQPERRVEAEGIFSFGFVVTR
jgi:hypothetical protein